MPNSAHARSLGAQRPGPRPRQVLLRRLHAAARLHTFFVADDELAYRPAHDKPGTYVFFYPALAHTDYSYDATGLQHLAFIVRSRSAVRAAHDHAVAVGSPIVEAPRHFAEYPPPYYATFWLDPFGFKLEAVCHHDTE